MMLAYAASGVITYKTWQQEISYYQGFLTFIPVFIVSYWFATFSMQLFDGKRSDGEPILGKKLCAVLNNLSTVISLILIGLWVYLYISRSLYAAG